MGTSVRSIPFVDNSITIEVVEASDGRFLGQFPLDMLNEYEIYVYEVIETGELIVRWSQGTRACFIKGKMVS